MRLGYNAAMSDEVTLERLVELLPPRIWYLTSNGTDMWCRRPYSFLFSTGEAAEAFARAMGTDDKLFAVGLEAGARPLARAARSWHGRPPCPRTPRSPGSSSSCRRGSGT